MTANLRHKMLGSIALIAGTTIGSGMLALPLMLAKIGLIPSCFIMLFMWFIAYYSSLVSLELNLQVGHGTTLDGLAKIFSGTLCSIVGRALLIFLNYSLFVAYTYGIVAVLKEFLASQGIESSHNFLATGCLTLSALIFLCPIRIVDYLNRTLFVTLLIVVGCLIFGLITSLSWHHLPLTEHGTRTMQSWLILVPITFSSFGFQVIFHTVGDYCKMEPKTLQRAFFWGSLLPLIVYVVWTATVIISVYHKQPDFYLMMSEGKANVGQLVHTLSLMNDNFKVQKLVWSVSILSLLTSIIGIGLALVSSWQNDIKSRHTLEKGLSVAKNLSRSFIINIAAVLAVVLPVYLISIYIPDVFLKALGAAGFVLVFIALIIPMFLLRKVPEEKFHYPILKNKLLKGLIWIAAIGIAMCELWA